MTERKTTVESTLQAALQFANRLITTSSGTPIYPDYSFLDKQKPAGDTIFIALYTDFFIMHIIALLDKLKHKVIDGYIPDEIVFNIHAMLVDSPYVYAKQLLQNEICNKTRFFANVDGVNALAYSCIPSSGESYIKNLKSISKFYLFCENKIFIITDASHNLIYMYVEDHMSIVTNHLFLIDPTNIHPVIFIDEKKQLLDWFMLSAIKHYDDDFVQSLVTMKKLEQNSQNLFSI